jgi:hypothetical protein
VLYKARHNRHLDIEHAANVITKAVPIFMEQVDLWHKWHGTSCTDTRAAIIFAGLVSPEFKALVKVNTGGSIQAKTIERNRTYKYLMDKYHTHYKNALGANLWSVYNTLTDWGTHIQSKSVNVAGIQHNRSVKIQKVLQTPYFIAA